MDFEQSNTYKKLVSFRGNANRQVLHPLDDERFYEAILAAHAEGFEPDLGEVSGFLQAATGDMAGFNKKEADLLEDKLYFGLSFIKFLEKSGMLLQDVADE